MRLPSRLQILAHRSVEAGLAAMAAAAASAVGREAAGRSRQGSWIGSRQSRPGCIRMKRCKDTLPIRRTSSRMHLSNPSHPPGRMSPLQARAANLAFEPAAKETPPTHLASAARAAARKAWRRREALVNSLAYPAWPMADVVAKGGIGRLR
eukprot:2319378-Prymnesium_polylepis.2